MKKVINFTLYVLYTPIYLLSWLLHEVARVLLAISYFGLLDFRRGKDIIKHLFKNIWEK